MNDVTTITSRDLPALRVAMCGYAAVATFSDEFRAICRAVVDAINQARDEDEATYAPLEASLNTFVAAGNVEMKRCDRIRFLCERIGDAETSATIRDALVELLPLLPARHILLISGVIAEALLDDAAPVIDFGLAELPAASDQLH